jgi:C_GCAxxG_C_C family probable redox protein
MDGKSFNMEKKMSDKSELAAEEFLNAYNCAQSVVSAFCEESGISDDMALKISCGLGGGMGRKQEVCGAVTGGILILGLRHGRGVNDEQSATTFTYQKTREFMSRFAESNGSYICRELLNGCDLTTEAGQQEFNDKDMKNSVCKVCVESAVEILEQIE